MHVYFKSCYFRKRVSKLRKCVCVKRKKRHFSTFLTLLNEMHLKKVCTTMCLEMNYHNKGWIFWLMAPNYLSLQESIIDFCHWPERDSPDGNARRKYWSPRIMHIEIGGAKSVIFSRKKPKFVKNGGKWS